jgi:hypothetical protein
MSMTATTGSCGGGLTRWAIPADVLVFAALAAVQALLALAHTPGRDELQAWLIARASHSPVELLANMQHEGHPPLWHALLMLVQWVTGSASPLGLRGLSLAIALATSALIVFRAPFSLALRVVVVLNYFVLFEYGTIARCYGIGMLATLCYAAAPKHRYAWLWIALLPHTSLHFALLGGALGLWHLLSVERTIKGPAFAIASAASALWLMWPHPATVVTGLAIDAEGRLLTSIVNLGALVVPMSVFGGWNFFGADRAWIPFNLAGAAVAVLMIWPLFRHRRETFAIACGLLVALLMLSCFVFICYARHFGVLVLFALAVSWRYWDDTRFVRGPFLVMSIWLAACGLIVGGASLIVPYTNYRAAVGWIEANGLAAQPWAAYPPHLQIEPAAWLGQPIYDVQKACRTEFPRWNFNHLPATNAPTFEALLDAAVIAHGGTLHIAVEGEPLRVRAGQTAVLLAEFPGAAFSNPFRLYQVQSALSVTVGGAIIACRR